MRCGETMKKIFLIILLFLTVSTFSIQWLEFSNEVNTDVLYGSISFPVFFDINNFAVEKFINETIYNDIHSFLRETYQMSLDTKRIAKETDSTLRKSNIFIAFKVFNFKNYLSIVIDYSRYTGGAHGITTRKAYNFDFQNGIQLKLSDLISNNTRKKIIEKINKVIENNKQRYFDKKIEYLSQEQFYLSKEGLIIFFQQYEIAPFASGIPEFKFNYTEIEFLPDVSDDF